MACRVKPPRPSLVGDDTLQKVCKGNKRRHYEFSYSRPVAAAIEKLSKAYALFAAQWTPAESYHLNGDVSLPAISVVAFRRLGR